MQKDLFRDEHYLQKVWLSFSEHAFQCICCPRAHLTTYYFSFCTYLLCKALYVYDAAWHS